MKTDRLSVKSAPIISIPTSMELDCMNLGYWARRIIAACVWRIQQLSESNQSVELDPQKREFYFFASCE